MQVWMKQNDQDQDGRLSYKEFKVALKSYLRTQADESKAEEADESDEANEDQH